MMSGFRNSGSFPIDQKRTRVLGEALRRSTSAAASAALDRLGTCSSGSAPAARTAAIIATRRFSSGKSCS